MKYFNLSRIIMCFIIILLAGIVSYAYIDLKLQVEELSNKYILSEQKNNEVNPWIGKKGLAIGDSITSFGQYVEFTKSSLELSTYEKLAMGGRPIANGSSNGEGLVDFVISHKVFDYDLITILAGTNDFKLNVPLGELSNQRNQNFDVDTFYGSYSKLIEVILESNPTVTILLITPPQRSTEGYDIYSKNEKGYYFKDYILAVENIGDMYSLDVLNLYSELGINNINMNHYMKDGLHPNELGDKLISEKISLYLKNNVVPMPKK